MVSGSGAFTKKNFKVDRLSSVISGSGSVNITANNHIEAVISGSGSINYSGNASVEKRVVGSGQVRKI
ncbi:putative auto-transporter adhesin, head GIN domain [compost metagenome]